MTSALRLVLLLGALTLLLAAPASASTTQESIFEDEHQLLELGPDARTAALDDISRLGADTVRSLVLWSRLAPAGGRRPNGFDGIDPAQYRAEAWDPYDDLVRGANLRGLGLLLSHSTPIPAWASDCRRGTKATCKPDPKQFGAFVTALGQALLGHPRRREPGSRPPASPPQASGEITISAASRLGRLLTHAGRAARVPRSLPVHYTEFGFQTNPRISSSALRVALQADYINQSDWMAYRDSRVRTVGQYKLVDDEKDSSFQTGIRFSRAKPAYDAYRLPIWVTRSGSNARVYGQVRPTADSTPQEVEIQVQPPGGVLETVQRVTVDSLKGHFLLTLPARRGVWRRRWSGLVSRDAKVSRR